jgi:predicted ArsR family transcriptional regulator
MKTIRTSHGTAIPLDNDLLAVVEALYRDVTVRLDLDRSFEDMMQEIRSLVEQMDPAERTEYLVESLFLNTVTYENERLGSLIRKLPSE